MAKKGLMLCIAAVMVLACHFSLSAQSKKASKEVELRWASIWVGADSKAVTVGQLVEEFNAANASKIKVVIEPQPDYNAYEQKVRTSLAAGTAPADIFTIKLNPTTAEFYNSKLLMDFTKAFDSTWKATFDAGMVKQSTIGKQLKSLPFETAILPMWYNMDLLAKAGFTAPPKTIDELWTLCDKLKAQNIYPSSQMTGDTNAWTSMIWFSHFAVSLGGPDVWVKPFTDPVFVEAANLTKRMITDYSTPDAVGLGAGGSGGHFLAGRTAIFSNGPWYAGRADLAATPFFKNITIAGLPAAGKTTNYMISRMQANICAAASKDKAKEAATIEFLKFLTSPSNVKRIAEASGAMFAVKTDAKPANHLQTQFIQLANAVSVTAPDFEAAYGSEATLEFTQMLGGLALGKISANDFVKAVGQVIERD